VQTDNALSESRRLLYALRGSGMPFNFKLDLAECTCFDAGTSTNNVVLKKLDELVSLVQLNNSLQLNCFMYTEGTQE